jgi:hypothetical protein
VVTPISIPDTYTACDNPRSYKWKRHICRCVACRDRTIAEQKRTAIRKARGQTNKFVDGKRTRYLLKKLQKRGFSYKWLAKHTGYSYWRITSIVKGNQPVRVNAILEKKLERLFAQTSHDPEARFDDRRDRDEVPATRAIRAIQGLMLQGYTGVWIAEQLGRPQQSISKVLAEHHDCVSIDLDRGLLELVRRVGLRPGPSDRVRAIAERRGYKALAEWDDFI